MLFVILPYQLRNISYMLSYLSTQRAQCERTVRMKQVYPLVGSPGSSEMTTAVPSRTAESHRTTETFGTRTLNPQTDAHAYIGALSIRAVLYPFSLEICRVSDDFFYAICMCIMCDLRPSIGSLSMHGAYDTLYEYIKHIPSPSPNSPSKMRSFICIG